MYVRQSETQFGQYVAKNPRKGVAPSPVAKAMKGFGQAAGTAPVYYPEPVLSAAGQLVVLGVSFGIMVLASFVGTRWALKKKQAAMRGLGEFGHGKTGPGKFEGGMEALKQLLFMAWYGEQRRVGNEVDVARQPSLDTSWLDEQEAYNDDEGWCGKMNGPIPLAHLQKQYPKEFAEIDAEDKREIAKAKGGAILCEDSQGFVDVGLFPTKKALEKKWEEVAASFESEEEGEGEDY